MNVRMQVHSTMVASRNGGLKVLTIQTSTGTFELEFTEERWTALAESAQWHWINAEQIAREQRESNVAVEISHEVIDGQAGEDPTAETTGERAQEEPAGAVEGDDEDTPTDEG